MYRHGKKVQTNRKYTDAEMKKYANELSIQAQFGKAEMFCQIAIMAYEDSKGQDTSVYVELLNKYLRDFEDGDFTRADVKKYNIQSIKDYFKDKERKC